MQEVVFVLIGVLGGLVRALYGFMKAVNKGQEINLTYFFSTLFVAGIIGGVLGTIFNTDYRITALAGYAGTDVLDNIFKASLGDVVIKK